MENTLRGLTRDQLEALRGYDRGVLIAHALAELAGPPVWNQPTAQNEAQKAAWAKTWQERGDELRATVDKLTAAAGAYADGVRFALAAPPPGEE